MITADKIFIGANSTPNRWDSIFEIGKINNGGTFSILENGAITVGSREYAKKNDEKLIGGGIDGFPFYNNKEVRYPPYSFCLGAPEIKKDGAAYTSFINRSSNSYSFTAGLNVKNNGYYSIACGENLSITDYTGLSTINTVVTKPSIACCCFGKDNVAKGIAAVACNLGNIANSCQTVVGVYNKECPGVHFVETNKEWLEEGNSLDDFRPDIYISKKQNSQTALFIVGNGYPTTKDGEVSIVRQNALEVRYDGKVLGGARKPRFNNELCQKKWFNDYYIPELLNRTILQNPTETYEENEYTLSSIYAVSDGYLINNLMKDKLDQGRIKFDNLQTYPIMVYENYYLELCKVLMNDQILDVLYGGKNNLPEAILEIWKIYGGSEVENSENAYKLSSIAKRVSYGYLKSIHDAYIETCLTDSVVSEATWDDKVTYWKDKAWLLWNKKLLMEYKNIYDMLLQESKDCGIATNILPTNKGDFLAAIYNSLKSFSSTSKVSHRVLRMGKGFFNPDDLDYVCQGNVNPLLFIREV